MEQLVSALVSITIFFVIVYAIVRTVSRTVLEPIHAKLDRLLALQEQNPAAGSVDSTRG